MAKYAVIGGGPEFHKDGRWPLYPPDRLDVYACKVLGRLLASTSDSGEQDLSLMREIERLKSLLAERDATEGLEHTPASYRPKEMAPPGPTGAAPGDRISSPSTPVAVSDTTDQGPRARD